MNWKMLSPTHFEGTEGDYKAIVHPNGGLGCGYWAILLNDVVVEDCYNHSPINSSNNREAAAKAKAEKEIKKYTTLNQIKIIT
jgi:hypothetical protein